MTIKTFSALEHTREMKIEIIAKDIFRMTWMNLRYLPNWRIRNIINKFVGKHNGSSMSLRNHRFVRAALWLVQDN